MKYPSPTEFKNNFSDEALEQLANQARATVEIHKDWSDDMKEAFARSTYQFFGYRALFQKYSKKIKELEKNNGNSAESQRLSQNYQKLRADYDSVCSTLEILKEKYNSIQLENMRLNSQVSDLQEQLEDAQTVSPHQNNADTEQLQIKLAELKKQVMKLETEKEELWQENQRLADQLKTAQPSAVAGLPEEANTLLKEIAQKFQKKQEISSELSFLELEKNCLSELISTIQPEDENFELPVLQERFAKNHEKFSSLQEQLQQTETELQELNQALQKNFS